MNCNNLTLHPSSRVLVTGAAGFIGSNLVESLLKMGVFVRGFDNFSTGHRENIELFLGMPGFEFIEGDIRSIKECEAACDNIDYVFHQAALGSVPRSISQPLLYEDNNIKGTLNMMEVARHTKKVKRFVFASSSSVYGDSNALPKIEGQEGNLLSPYAVTKYVNEYYGSIYTRLYGLPCIGLRYFNVFGRRQDPHSQYAAVIPLFAKKMLAGEAPLIHGDGEQSRDFTYIENVIEANVRACLAPLEATGKSYNIAFGQSISINRLFQIMCEYLDFRGTAVYGPARDGDIKHSLANINQARASLNYSPAWNFSSGLGHAIKWYQKYLK